MMDPQKALVVLAVSLVLVNLPALSAGPKVGSLPRGEDWRTPTERAEYRTTPRYDETMAYLRRLAAAAPRQLKLETFGVTGEGRDLYIAIASKDGVFEPITLHRAKRPIVLIQNSIHAGEMDGKDSCLALLRDMVVTREKASLLERAVVVVIPIYNADGHERFGPHNRINQNGPEEAGWRTQSRNLNLNRDYMKADAPETRAFLKLWNRWLPDFFVDDHVTDGADFVYDTTYSLDSGPDVFPALAAWQRDVLGPRLERSVADAGHPIAPFIALRDDADPSQGMVTWPSTPRYSTGYVILQNRPGLLVEMHMLKDYRSRVTGNYEVLRALLEVVNRDADALVTMNRDADAATVAAGRRHDPAARFPLRLEAESATETFRFQGRSYRRTLSEVSGALRIEYGDAPALMDVRRPSSFRVAYAVAPPAAYIVPAQWTSVIDVLAFHGLRLRRTSRPWAAEVETYRCDEVKWLDRPFEGRQVLFRPQEGPPGSEASRGACEPAKETLSFPRGSAVIPLDQRAAKVAIHFLEPEGPDSAVAWGFFNAVFEQKEYGEAYVLEKLARDMLEKDPRLKEEFERKLAEDRDFAASPAARLDFFYRRSPWWDSRMGLYPVGRLASLEGVPLDPERQEPGAP